MSHVAGPGAIRAIEPDERENGEERAHDFVKELLEHAPQAAESALIRGSSGGAGGGRHKSSLAQKRSE